MPQVLTEEVHKTIVVAKKDITSFTPMMKQGILYITYNELDIDGNIVGEQIITSDGKDFENVILSASTIAGVDIYGPLKLALYNEIERITGELGPLE